MLQTKLNVKIYIVDIYCKGKLHGVDSRSPSICNRHRVSSSKKTGKKGIRKIIMKYHCHLKFLTLSVSLFK